MFPIYCKDCGEQIAATEVAEVVELTKDKLVCGDCVPTPDVEEEDEDEGDDEETEEKE